jgi:CheY-like chemotaxis protein
MNGATQSRRMRILVVDDNVEAAGALREFLEEIGYDVRAATDASAALAAARTFIPEVAILDIELGAIDGYELGQHLRADGRLAGCVLIACTGYNQQDGVARSRQAGFRYHLSKPLDLDRLQGILRELSSELSALQPTGAPGHSPG